MELKELLLKRRSIRKYLNEEVPDEVIKEIIEATRYAPSWKNSQTARYYAVKSPEVLEKIKKCGLPEGNAKKAEGAALVVTTFKKNIAGHTDGNPDNEAGNMWGAYDLGLSNSYMILKASELGYDTLIMGLRFADPIKEILSIPDDEQIMSVIVLGKRDSEGVLNPRKELEEILKII